MLALVLSLAVVAAATIAVHQARAAQSPAATPVLGLAGLMGEQGEGWGAIKPARIYNGGVLSGLIERIRWRDWGDRVATGVGRKFVYKPGGGYYDRKVAVRIRARRLGTCPAAPGQPAYTRMTISHRVRPGGPWTVWAPWTLDLCDFDARPRPCRRVAFAPRSDHGAFEIRAWDVRCRVARRLARASRQVRIRRDRGDSGTAEYAWRWRRFACSGYSLSRGTPLPTIVWTCYRGTAQITFKRS